MWKDFLYFTKTERQGIIVLVVLIIGAFSLPRLWQHSNVSADAPPPEDEIFKKEYEDFISSLKEIKPQRKYAKDSFLVALHREIKLSAFDPNTADSATFLSLGLPSWMAKNILRYRSKKGKFRRREDFRKIYGLTEEQYQTLFPYIRIARDTAVIKDTIRLLTEHPPMHDSLFKYKPGTIISLNEADTTELKKIPGIGSAIARMIVNYRTRLGGFYKIEQLEEIHLKADLLREWFSVNAGEIECIHINKASVGRMMHHPYINYYQAKVIAEYRKKKKAIHSLKQLSLYEEFSAGDFERMAPYICYD